MYRVFNMGIGLTLVVNPFFAESLIQQLKEIGHAAYVIGRIKWGERHVSWA